jgi:hypothetical protein
MSKLRFDIPPTGGAPAAGELKSGELADRVADFIEMAPLDLRFGRVLGTRSNIQRGVYGHSLFFEARAGDKDSWRQI